MSLEFLKDWTPFGLVVVAVGYLYTSRPTRKEIESQLDTLKERQTWMMDTLWEMARGTTGVKPPPKGEKHDETDQP